MITRIELKNFMSHEHTVIEPAAGLTVLVGPNNVGKSAVVAALQILCHNENSTYVLRHGEKECSVEVQTEDGHTVTWRRKQGPSYLINGAVFDRLRGAGLPDELHQALRLPKVDAGGDADFDVHFGTQKSPIFLLGSSGSIAARFFASSSDAIRLVAMQDRHREKLSDAKQEKKRLDDDSKRVNAELECLGPVVDAARRLEVAEQAYDELLLRDAWLIEARKCEAMLEEQSAELGFRAARASALAPLAPPPDLAPTEELASLTRAIEKATAGQSSLVRRSAALAQLPSPPPMHEVAALANLAQRLTAQMEQAGSTERERRLLARLTNPPQLAESGALAAMIVRLHSAEREVVATSVVSATLTTLAPPPELVSVYALFEAISKLEAASKLACRWEGESSALANVGNPPAAAEIHPLHSLLAGLANAEQSVRSLQSELQTAKTELAAATVELRERAAGQQCPVCGSALDPDRVIRRATMGMDVHNHE